MKKSLMTLGVLALFVLMAYGRWFAVREGGRTVGSGRVATIIE